MEKPPLIGRDENDSKNISLSETEDEDNVSSSVDTEGEHDDDDASEEECKNSNAEEENKNVTCTSSVEREGGQNDENNTSDEEYVDSDDEEGSEYQSSSESPTEFEEENETLSILSTDAEDSGSEEEDLSAEDVALDQSYSPALCERKKRFNQMQQVKSLQSLSLTAAVNNLDYFCKIEHPFRGLPGLILKMLTDVIVKTTNSEMNHKLQCSLITKRTSQLRLQLYSASLKQDTEKTVWYRHQVNKLIQLVQQNCKNKLVLLTLKVCMESTAGMTWCPPQPTLAQLHDIVRHQENLQELDISACQIDDKTLSVIGYTCGQLRCLNVSDNKHVTNSGVTYLYAYGKCLKLEQLKTKGTLVDINGVVAAIKNLPLLEELTWKKQNFLCFALMFLDPVHHEQVPIKLKYMSFSQARPKDIKRMCNMLPYMSNLTHLTVACDDDVDLSLFLKLQKNVTHLDLQSNVPTTVISNLIAHFGTNVLELSLIQCDNAVIDISMIGKYCPNIKIVFLDQCRISSACEYEDNIASYFNQLTQFQVTHCVNDDIVLPDSLLTHILSRESLIGYFSYQIIVPIDVIYSLLTEARQNHQVFSNLERIIIYPNIQDDLSMWIELICVAPKIRLVDLCGALDEGDMALLKKFVKRHKLNNIFITNMFA